MQPLEYGKYYHIYNRGINGETLFLSEDNYLYFLKLYDKYISKVADTFAWCLMRNHFHFLVKIKEIRDIEVEIKSPDRFVYQQFSNLFNAYSKSFNKREHRHGALFERPFRRKVIHGESYFKQLILYIHLNPVHHGLVDTTTKYPWTSYQTIVSDKLTKLNRKEVLDLFDDKTNFIFAHQEKASTLIIENW